MRNYTIILVFISFCSFGYCQEKGDTLRTVMMSLKSYKAKLKEPISKADSLKFKIINNDTFIIIKDYVRPKGVSVPYEFKDSTFLHYYKKVAFNHKNDSVDKKTTMKYWKNDIKIFFSSSISKKIRNDFMSFVEELDKQVDSLKISKVRKLEDSNYTIYYFGDYDYEPRMTNYKNSDFYIYWKNNKIYKGTIKIDPNKYFNDRLRLYIMKDLFFKTLGRFRLIDDFDCTSYFSNCYSENKTLNPMDLELLKYHYSYGICKGTDLETFEEQHRRAKETLRKHNHLMNFFHPE